MARLADEGVLEARPGHGTFLAARRAEPPAAADFAWQGIALGAGRITAEDVTALLARAPAGAINLAGGYPSDDLQAVELVSRALARAARRPGVWGRMPLEGIEGLRTWFARQLGPSVTAREVVVCPGSQAAIATAFNALVGTGCAGAGGVAVVRRRSRRGPGRRPAPGPGAHRRARRRPRAAGPRLRDLGRARLLPAAAATPTPPARPSPRRGASRCSTSSPPQRAVLIEDDWCRDLTFEKAPPRPLIADDRHGHCVYLRSLTKSTAPGLRIGAIVARGAALARLTASRVVTEFFVSGPMQEAALEVVHAPAWQRHLRRLRETLAARRDVVASAVRRQFGEASLALLPSGGIHLWVRLPDAVDAEDLARRAAEAGVIVSPGRRWFPAEPTGSFLRVSCACAGEGELDRAIETVARLAGAAGPPALQRLNLRVLKLAATRPTLGRDADRRVPSR